ncbi:succinyldiaminopimelate transaminase [Salinibacterium sp. NG253]|uniref:succinyldiaminopimelate transaminase n=1 Tax=unclassified Salinibacterium TaxID=2632331 RepID=UPI0018CFC9F3|nr:MULTISPECIES: succinyldiaminopimelate transaminase [unclassified Salinibacterium]MBH0054625.1 succinyldiaminopimelate transaminase [Salinibacterium sp. SWN139]MBH0117616.1 succinyldiaminopimelate transaminase [Salinibacterium sp. NG253]
MARTPLALPDFPWDSLVPYGTIARTHPDGFVDLSVGSPVDPTPTVIRESLATATDAHAYPTATGTVQLREAIVDWFERRRGVPGLTVNNILPTVGSKELVALLPLLLGLGKDDVVVHPSVAYPTYAIGAAMVGATAVASDDPASWPENTALVWLNSPGNPDGRVADVEQLRAAVARARELGAVIASDECYAELNWNGPDPTPSILDPEVIGSDRSSVLAVYSLSKQSNLAGYRAAFVAGCSGLISELLTVRKHVGLLVPGPVQAAMVTALQDDAHVAAQRELYRARRAKLLPALKRAGFFVDDSVAGLYLWATKNEDSWQTVGDLAQSGILVVPGSFYGETPARHVRIALTASDDTIADAVARLDLLA